MDTKIFEEIIANKNTEIKELYNIKINKNKKMIDPSKLDYNTTKTLNLINASLKKKHESSAAYKKSIEKQMQEII